MKYEKFIKKVVPHGALLIVDKVKYLTDDEMYVRLPNWCGNIGTERKDTELLKALLDDGEWIDKPAHLTRAFLPNADDKGKDIIRVFEADNVEVCITNEQFGYIEKTDFCFIVKLENYKDFNDITALLVGKQSDFDNFEPNAIILNVEV